VKGSLRYLDEALVFDLIARLEVGPVRDAGLIASALARPKASVFGVDAYPTLALKAAALLESLVRNHALIDGNKRLAWAATEIFVQINGHVVDLDDDDAFSLVMATASGACSLEEVAAVLAPRPR
jgi:death-on-curing protein